VVNLLSKPKILIVDDDVMVRKLLGAFLESYGAEHDECSNGFEAFELVAHRHYDMVFMDIMMPELDGLSSCKSIRDTELEGLPEAQIKIIGVTGNGGEEEIKECYENGMTDVLLKPFSKASVGEMLVKHLAISND